jgi:hypothetical protein
MITIKLPFSTPDKSVISACMKSQAPVIKFLFNRINDSNGNLTQKELTSLANSMNHVSVDSWFKQSAVYEAGSIYGSYYERLQEIIKYNDSHPGTKKKLPTVIFGSRKNFIDRCKGNLSREEFIERRDPPLVSVGEAPQKGNRKFELHVLENNTILFKPELGIKIDLQLPHLRKNYQKILSQLQTLMEHKKLPVTVKLDLTYIYITYDEKFLFDSAYSPTKDRIMTVDLNPNFIGYSILDWSETNSYKIVHTGVISIKKLNDLQFSLKKKKFSSSHPKNIKLTNQRHFEIYEISKALCNIATYYHCECFGMELLSMRSSDKGKGSKYNRLVNNMWCREILENNLKKRLKISGVKLIGIPAAYSSYVGNLLHREFPDMIAASIELNRRAFLIHTRKTFALFPSFTQSVGALTQSLEELGLEASKLIPKVKGWKDLCGKIKNLRLRYRVPLDSFEFKVFRLDHSPWVDSFLSFSMV